jgi:hypothetical protein
MPVGTLCFSCSAALVTTAVCITLNGVCPVELTHTWSAGCLHAVLCLHMPALVTMLLSLPLRACQLCQLCDREQHTARVAGFLLPLACTSHGFESGKHGAAHSAGSEQSSHCELRLQPGVDFCTNL